MTYLSYHDKLTNLNNRRYFDDYIDSIVGSKNSIVVVYSDINNLKVMNDMFGHDVGDELLLTVSQSINNAFRNIGIVARTGGDEIVTIIEKGKLEDINKIVEHLKQEFKTIKVHDIEVSVSFGVAVAKNGRSINDALLIAEDLMYKDKLKAVFSHRIKNY